MEEYPKIQTVFKRDTTKQNKVIVGEYSLPEFEYLANNGWVFTEKVDGTNTRVEYNGEKLLFGGKTDDAQMPVVLFQCLSDIFLDRMDLFREGFPKGICLYGEGYGTKIRKQTGNYGRERDFVLIDVMIDGWWLRRPDVEDIASRFGISVVPIVGTGNLHTMVEMVREGFKSAWGDFIAEGIVARPVVDLKTRDGSRVITKIKYKDFPRG